jgi:trans-aconitate methyltransferase
MGLFFSTDVFRHVCTMCLLKTKLKSPPSTVALIGDGPGIMSAFLHETWPSARLILIDLGATLAVQAQNLEKAYPKDVHVVAGGGGRTRILPTYQLKIWATFPLARLI